MKLLAIFLVLSCGSNVVSPAEMDAAITENQLVRRTQELYDAVVPGNQVPWKKYFANDCIFADEKGRTMDKRKLVADITPMPAGYSGAIKIEQLQSRIYDNVAILSYDANETETIFDQNVSARYHVTDTWLRRDGNWQIIASQSHRYYEDPAMADPSQLRNNASAARTFVGTYELAPGQTRTVTLENGASRDERHGRKSREVAVERSGELPRYTGKLFIERNGKKEQLFPETSDLFFRKGVEGRILFRYDAYGKIDALIDRRNNEDVVWRKTK